MKKFIIGSILAAMFIVPGVASAHSGSVTCGASGVVFHYNGDFPITTTVTEHITSVTPNVNKTFVVTAHTAATDTIPFTGLAIASSTWVGGGTIPPTTLNCPTPPANPVAPVCPAGTVSDSLNYLNSNLVELICVRTVTNTVTNTITVHDLAPTPVYNCPKGYKQNNFIPGLLTCTRTVIKNHTKTKIVKQRVLIPWCPLPPHKTPGVTG